MKWEEPGTAKRGLKILFKLYPSTVNKLLKILLCPDSLILSLLTALFHAIGKSICCKQPTKRPIRDKLRMGLSTLDRRACSVRLFATGVEFEHFRRVSARGFSDFGAAEHAGQFFCARFGIEFADAA